MAKQHTRRWLLPVLLLTSVGCGFPHDRYQSDPLLGMFLRPIAATPPIWTGGDPGVSPAYDGGARMGLPSPDVPASSNFLLDRMFLVPTFSGSGSSGSQFRSPGGGTGDVPSDNKPVRKINPVSAGAHMMPTGPERTPIGVFSASVPLAPAAPRSVVSPVSAIAPASPAPAPAPVPATPPAPGPSASTVTPRPLDTHTILTSGSSMEAAIPPTKPLSPSAAMKDPRSVYSVDEAQNILQACGAKSMMMEPQPTGDWRFICTINDGADLRRYEAKAVEPIEAVRQVLWQVKNGQ